MTVNLKYHLTFDVDWAPESSLALVSEILANSKIRATFLATHDSDIIQDLKRDGHEIGIHPNFLPGTTQGTSPLSIVSNLLDLFPEAKVMRTHSLFQSSPLLYEIFGNFPQLKLDLSLSTHRFPHVGSFVWNYQEVSFNRINYNWEDDVAFYDEGFDWSKSSPPGPLSIYNFHPIHVHLNSHDLVGYNSLKQGLAGPLNKATDREIGKFASRDAGSKNFLEAIVTSIATPLSLEELICELE